MLNAYTRQQILTVTNAAERYMFTLCSVNKEQDNLTHIVICNTLSLASASTETQVQQVANLLGAASVALSYESSRESDKARSIITSLSMLWNDYAKDKFNGPAFNNLASYLSEELASLKAA